MIEDMHSKRSPGRRRKKPAPSLRSQALRFLEQCERGLVDAYRGLPDGLLSRADARRLAALHEDHAALLAECAHRQDGHAAGHPYDHWITEATISGMRFAEQSSFTTYRDQLSTLAPAAAHAIRTRIMPDHYQAAEHLAEVAARRGRRWRHAIHTPLRPRATPQRRRQAH